MSQPAAQPLPSPELSVVLPCHDEEANIAALLAEIDVALATGPTYEILCVDDASGDQTPVILHAERTARAPRLRVLRHRENYGQSAALWTGIKAARAPWIVTMDSDGQNDPADIPSLLRARDSADDPNLAMVAGVRTRRRDSLSKRVASQVANRIRRAALRDATTDTGCGLKLIRRSVAVEMPYFDHMHRFYPALARRQGGNVIEVPVNHRPRGGGRSHYTNWHRLRVGIFDLMGVAWLQRRREHPVMEADELEEKC